MHALTKLAHEWAVWRRASAKIIYTAVIRLQNNHLDTIQTTNESNIHQKTNIYIKFLDRFGSCYVSLMENAVSKLCQISSFQKRLFKVKGILFSFTFPVITIAFSLLDCCFTPSRWRVGRRWCTRHCLSIKFRLPVFLFVGILLLTNHCTTCSAFLHKPLHSLIFPFLPLSLLIVFIV